MAKKVSRRELLGLGAASVAGGLIARANRGEGAITGWSTEYGSNVLQNRTNPRRYWDESYSGGKIDVKPLAPGLPGREYSPVMVPDGGVLPFKIVNGIKVFHLIAEEVDHAFDPGLKAKCWGFNGRVNSTVIEAVEGERVRIYVTNRLPVGTSIHWHGFFLPNGMDGVGGLTQPYIRPGDTAKYEWTIRQHGSLMYHSHHDEMTQMGMGMIGMFVVHPRNPTSDYCVNRDFVLLLSEWTIAAGTARPNTIKMNARFFLPRHRLSAKPAIECASAWATLVRWIITRYIFTVITSESRRQTAEIFPLRVSGPKIPFSLALARRTTSNSSPMRQAIGHFTAT